MGDLVAFLRARIDEDEQYGHLTLHVPAGQIYDGERWVDVRVTGQQVLREAQAKRALLNEIESELADDDTCEMPRWRLQVLAAVYNLHPDYDPTWAPEAT